MAHHLGCRLTATFREIRMFITNALALSHVPRWAVVRTVRSQSVAEHSFNVAMIVKEILEMYPQLELSGKVRADRTIWHALTHDLEESVTGDIPRHAKKMLGIRGVSGTTLPQEHEAALFLLELNIVKLADTIEAYVFIQMNGVGPHAMSVAQRTKLDINRIADKLIDELIDQAPLLRMCADMVKEEGRDEVTGSGPNSSSRP